MNHYVPDFEIDDDFAMPTASSSSLIRSKKSPMHEDEIMELLWQNGQVVMQNQAQRPLKKSPLLQRYDSAAVIPAAEQSSVSEVREVRSDHQHHQQPPNLFMQEDEMASWLHYPLGDTNFDHDFCADLLYAPTTACVTTATAAAAPPTPVRSSVQESQSRPNATVSASASTSRPPIPPARRAEVVQNFAHFSRHRPKVANESGPGPGPGPASVRTSAKDVTVVDSSDTPSVPSQNGVLQT